jgi:hypothetical protein
MTAIASHAVAPRDVIRSAAPKHHDSAEASVKQPAHPAHEGWKQLARQANAAKVKHGPSHEDERAAGHIRSREEIAPKGGHDTPTTPTGKRLDKIAATVEQRYDSFVKQLDKIRRAVESGDQGAQLQAFGRARSLFASIVSLGNEARIDMSTDNKHDDRVRGAIGDTVVNAYKIANAIEDAMPGNAHV